MAKVDKSQYTKEEWKILKQKRSSEKKTDKSKKKTEKILSNISNDKYTVLCVRFGNKYGIEYVEKLRNMVSRHISVPYEFVCLTDDPTPISGVRLIVQKNAGYTKGWWHKVHMFDPNLPLEGRILYLDLDVVICGNLDRLVTVYKHDFLGIRDFNRKFYKNWKNLNSSVLSWVHRSQTHIWNQFCSSKTTAMRLHGDQDWIWKTSKDNIKFFPDSWIQSYKWEIRSKTELQIYQGKRKFRTVNNNIQLDSQCCIAVFHGDPNPADVEDKFVVDNWR